MSREVDVAIVGGGISGLCAAFALASRRPELRLCVLEASSRVGGCIRTERQDGFVIEAGPDSFLRTKPEAAALCRELGLGDELVSVRPEARSAYLVHRGKLERLPAGMVLAAPTRLGPFFRTPLLTLPGKLRALGDLFVPKSASVEDESIESFLTRRFGAEVATRIGAPLLGGIYAGDIGELSLHATFPQLALLEQRFRSVTYGMLLSAATGAGEAAAPSRLSLLKSWIKRRPEAAQSPFLSLRGGLQTLVDGLERRLGASALQKDDAVVAIERDGDAFVVRSTRGPLRARSVLLTLPAPSAARALPAGRLSNELAGIRYGSTATVVFAFDKATVRRALDASGFLVPPAEGRILAATWVSSKWEGRAPDDAILVRAYVGGSHGAAELALPDAELVELARSELERLSGPFGAPLFTRLFRHEKTRPQPAVGHRERLERVNDELGRLPGLRLAGAGYDGVGIPDCIRQARAAAEAIAASLSARS
jgi:protoporphyrinogen/coproporphyrinogen III oxidase